MVMIRQLGYIYADPKRYVWGAIKLPSNLAWKNAKVYTEKEYTFTRIEFLDAGDNLHIRFRPRRSIKGQQSIILTIKNYKELCLNEVLIALYGLHDPRVDHQLYPMGRHFDDGIRHFWHDHGLSFYHKALHNIT